jgi:hypothetical protein
MTTIGPGKKRTIVAHPVDNSDQPAPIDGMAIWDATPPGFINLFPSSDGLTCDLVYVAPSGTTTVVAKCTGDAIVGTGVKEFSSTVDVQTTGTAPLEATKFNFDIGPEVDI